MVSGNGSAMKIVPPAIAGVVVLAVACAPFVARAQTVHKCVGADGSVVYQSQACGAGQVAQQSWAAEPDVLSASELRERRSRERANSAYLQKLARRYRRPAARGTAISSHSNARACEAAKARRSKAEAGSKRLTLKQLERLGDAVYEACK